MFVSKNEPETFGWHDAEITKICYENEDMIWEVDALNVLSSNSQNSEEFDCCISTAEVAFKNYHIKSIKQYGFREYQGIDLIEEQSDRMLSCEKISKLLNDIYSDLDNIIISDTGDKYVIYIHGIESSMEGTQIHISCDVDLMTGENSIVCFEIICEEVIVKWEKFEGKSWYYARKNHS